MRRFMFFLAAAFAAMILSAPMAAMAADKTVQAPKIEKAVKGDKAPPAATDPHWLLDLAQDEGSTETKIAGYIALFHKIKARHYLSKKNKKDVLLLYELAPPKAAKIPVVVNTRPSVMDPKTKKFKVRLIEVKATYALPMEAKTDANLAKIRKLNEEFMWRLWSPYRIYITPRKNIRMASFVNQSGTVYKVHPEMVYDLLVRMMNSWGIYYNMLIKAVPEAAARPKLK